MAEKLCCFLVSPNVKTDKHIFMIHDKLNKKSLLRGDWFTMKKTFLYVSNWSEFGGKPGIGLYEFDSKEGKLIFREMLDEEISCGAVCADKKKGILYFANEVETNPNYRAGGGGRIYAFRINPRNGKLTKINYVDTLCPNPCHLALDQTGQYLLVAHHSSSQTATVVEQKEDGGYQTKIYGSDATVALFSLKKDGALGTLVDLVKHKGSGPSGKQISAHPHSVTRSPSGKLHGVTDKGNDTVRFYSVQEGRLQQCGEAYHLPPGSAPRYLLFHPTAHYFYLNHEIGLQVRSFSYTEEGKICPAAEIDLGSKENIWPDIEDVSLMTNRNISLENQKRPGELQGFCMTKDGNHIYTTSHRPSKVAVLSTDEKGGLKVIQQTEIMAEWPRCCALSPDERFLLVGCLKNGEIFVYRVDEDGKLMANGHSAMQSAPTALTFWETEDMER